MLQTRGEFLKKSALLSRLFGALCKFPQTNFNGSFKTHVKLLRIRSFEEFLIIPHVELFFFNLCTVTTF